MSLNLFVSLFFLLISFVLLKFLSIIIVFKLIPVFKTTKNIVKIVIKWQSLLSRADRGNLGYVGLFRISFDFLIMFLVVNFVYIL